MISGPCLPWCSCDDVTQTYALIAKIYLGASVIYMITTLNMGTPFKDSLSETQKNLLQSSKRARARHFALGVVLTSFFIAIGK